MAENTQAQAVTPVQDTTQPAAVPTAEQVVDADTAAIKVDIDKIQAAIDDLKAKGEPTFDLVINPSIYTTDEFTKEMISLVREDPQIFERDPDFDFLSATEHKLPIKFFLFCKNAG